MKALDDAERERAAEAKRNRERMDPKRLAFADLMRETFGDGVRLLRSVPWPGGSGVSTAGKKYR